MKFFSMLYFLEQKNIQKGDASGILPEGLRDPPTGTMFVNLHDIIDDRIHSLNFACEEKEGGFLIFRTHHDDSDNILTIKIFVQLKNLAFDYVEEGHHDLSWLGNPIKDLNYLDLIWRCSIIKVGNHIRKSWKLFAQKWFMCEPRNVFERLH